MKYNLTNIKTTKVPLSFSSKLTIFFVGFLLRLVHFFKKLLNRPANVFLPIQVSTVYFQLLNNDFPSLTLNTFLTSSVTAYSRFILACDTVLFLLVSSFSCLFFLLHLLGFFSCFSSCFFLVFILPPLFRFIFSPARSHPSLFFTGTIFASLCRLWSLWNPVFYECDFQTRTHDESEISYQPSLSPSFFSKPLHGYDWEWLCSRTMGSIQKYWLRFIHLRLHALLAPSWPSQLLSVSGSENLGSPSWKSMICLQVTVWTAVVTTLQYRHSLSGNFSTFSPVWTATKKWQSSQMFGGSPLGMDNSTSRCWDHHTTLLIWNEVRLWLATSQQYPPIWRSDFASQK